MIQIPTRRTSKLVVPHPFGMVWHTTDTPASVTGETLARRIVEYPEPGHALASWNLLLDRDGSFFQSAPLSVGTWHCGKEGSVSGTHFENINKATFGVEILNSGRVKQLGTGFYSDPFFRDGTKTPDSRLLLPPMRARLMTGDPSFRAGYFDTFSEEQEKSAELLVRAAVAWQGWDATAFQFGHVNYDGERKEDPGPIFMGEILPRILSRIFGGICK